MPSEAARRVEEGRESSDLSKQTRSDKRGGGGTENKQRKERRQKEEETARSIEFGGGGLNLCSWIVSTDQKVVKQLLRLSSNSIYFSCARALRPPKKENKKQVNRPPSQNIHQSSPILNFAFHSYTTNQLIQHHAPCCSAAATLAATTSFSSGKASSWKWPRSSNRCSSVSRPSATACRELGSIDFYIRKITFPHPPRSSRPGLNNLEIDTYTPVARAKG